MKVKAWQSSMASWTVLSVSNSGQNSWEGMDGGSQPMVSGSQFVFRRESLQGPWASILDTGAMRKGGRAVMESGHWTEGKWPTLRDQDEAMPSRFSICL